MASQQQAEAGGLAEVLGPVALERGQHGMLLRTGWVERDPQEPQSALTAIRYRERLGALRLQRHALG